eukprot:Clim_evm4s59 gene=Clim_evmTU4s59
MHCFVFPLLLAVICQAAAKTTAQPTKEETTPRTKSAGIHAKSHRGGISYVLERWEGQQLADGSVEESNSNQDSNGTMGMDFYHNQRLDHFDLSDEQFWSQRYAWRTDFYNQTGPVFIQIGGEGPISIGYVSSMYYVELAKEHGALLLAPEHRFYGESQPLPDLSVRSLEYLNSAQALEDLARFQAWALKKFDVPKGTPVIVFGGSYPGNLSAWYRLKYPHLVIGSVASSAPVEAETDFYQYLEVVAHALQFFGGNACKNRVRSAFSAIDAILNDQDTDDRQNLADAFHLCSVKPDVMDDATVVSFLAGNIMGMTQYNSELPGQPTVADFCNALNGQNAPKDDLLALAQTYDQIFPTADGDCIDTSYDSTVKALRHPTDPSDLADRSWLWQTCYEFGYYQTTDGTEKKNGKYDIFGTGLDLTYYLQLCEDLYGTLNRPPTSELNRRYGGKAYAGSSVLFVNGGIDPWHVLSVLDPDSPDLSTVFNPASAHCADMLLPSDGEAQGVDEMRGQVRIFVANLLCEHSSDFCH